MPAHVVTGVQCDAQERIARVRWYLTESLEPWERSGAVPPPLSAESVVATLEVVDKLLDGEPVVPLFVGPDGVRLGARVKVGVQPDGSETIEVDPPLEGHRLRDLPRL